MIAEQTKPESVRALQIDQLNAFTVELGELLASTVQSMAEAAYRGSTYLARAHAEQARKILVEVMKTTAEAQALECAQRSAEGGAE